MNNPGYTPPVPADVKKGEIGDERMDDLLKAYLDQAEELIGERTLEEVAYDKEVIKQLRKGRDIKKALKMAAREYPSEALQWDEETLGDIAAHYEYLLEHEKITEKLSALANSGATKH
jgi:hypothetical protein